jgi:hypothetical protein
MRSNEDSGCKRSLQVTAAAIENEIYGVAAPAFFSNLPNGGSNLRWSLSIYIPSNHDRGGQRLDFGGDFCAACLCREPQLQGRDENCEPECRQLEPSQDLF